MWRWWWRYTRSWEITHRVCAYHILASCECHSIVVFLSFHFCIVPKPSILPIHFYYNMSPAAVMNIKIEWQTHLPNWRPRLKAQMSTGVSIREGRFNDLGIDITRNLKWNHENIQFAAEARQWLGARALSRRQTYYLRLAESSGIRYVRYCGVFQKRKTWESVRVHVSGKRRKEAG